MKQQYTLLMVFCIGFLLASSVSAFSFSDLWENIKISLGRGSFVELEGGYRCYDSDGGINPGVKGYIEMSKPSVNYLGPREWDYCHDSTTLIEKGCTNTQILYCPFGCSDGKCNNNPTNTGSCPSGTTSYYCSSLAPNSRFVCNPYTGVTTSYACPSGETCSSGQCVPIVQPSYNYCPSGKLYCSSLDRDVVVKCDTSNGKITTYKCASGNLCEQGECKPYCPYGKDFPYCSRLGGDEYSYYVCEQKPFSKEVVVNKYSCRSGYKCGHEDCYRDGVFPSGDRVSDVIGQVGHSIVKGAANVIDTVTGGFFSTFKSILIWLIVIALVFIFLPWILPFILKWVNKLLSVIR
jgi:hypothetical protein